MSASLVGSEMCIRDSDFTQATRVARLIGGGVRSSAAIRGAVERAAYLRAVSYTHLTLPTICSV
eukprot:5801111-Alexandrium_andersonii.AAC.1